jgi:hypothetical protein
VGTGAAESGVGDGAAGAGSWDIGVLSPTVSEEVGFVVDLSEDSPLVTASSVPSVGLVGRSVLGVWEELPDCSEILREFNEGGDDMVMTDEWWMWTALFQAIYDGRVNFR